MLVVRLSCECIIQGNGERFAQAGEEVVVASERCTPQPLPAGKRAPAPHGAGRGAGNGKWARDGTMSVVCATGKRL